MGNKKLKVYQEEAKLRQTTHWDLDYMTTAELDAFFSVKQSGKTQDSGKIADNSRVNGSCSGETDNSQQGLRQRQRSHGKAVVAALLKFFRHLADLWRGKVGVYSVDR
jgi:hypothetical protein